MTHATEHTMHTTDSQHTNTGLSWVVATLLLTALIASCQLLNQEPPPLTQPLADLSACPEPVCPTPTCPDSPTPTVAPQPTTNAPTATPSGETDARINLNTATLQQLTQLPGVGPRTAERIIAERDRRPFKRPRDLLRVKGIGPAKFNRVKEHVRTR